MQSPALPYPLIGRLQVTGGWILAILLMLAIFVLMRDLLWLIAQLTGRKAMAQIMHIPALGIGALVVAASLSAIGVFNALQPPRAHEQQLVVGNLPGAQQGLRIGGQAERGNDARYGKTIVERTMAATPDLILPPSIEVLTLTAEKYKRRLWFSCKKSDSIFSLYFYNEKHLQSFETFCINQTVLRLKVFSFFCQKMQ